MELSQDRRGAASTLLLVRLGEEHGLPSEVCLAGTGLELATLLRPGAEITAEQELSVLHTLVRARPAIDLAVQAGRRYHLTTYGIWGFALASSATVGQALDVGLRFVDLSFALCRLQVERDDVEVRLVLDDAAVPADVRAFVVVRDLVALTTLAGELMAGALALRRVEVTMPELPPTWPLPDTLPARRRTLVALDLQALDLPLPQADELTAAATRAQCRDLLAARRRRTGVAAQVRDALTAVPQAMPPLPRVAESLAMSERSLRRRLAAEGTSYRALAEEVRELLADELLRAGLAVGQVAGRLGYAETASFTHAFTRWKGCSPTAHRAGLPTR